MNLDQANTTTSATDMNGPGPTGVDADAQAIAKQAWFRYEYVRQRGHIQYCKQARKCDNFYLGGGLQWDQDDIDYLEQQGRKPIEFNEVMDAVNTALGYQIQNRVDITYRPRGNGADNEIAATLTKLAMQFADDNDLKHAETQVFSDGLIEQRGYYELRLNFDMNLRGKIVLGTLDPMDVIPDPEGRQYDPDTWADVHITRFMNMDQIETNYGLEARTQIEQYYGVTGDTTEMISSIDEIPRSTFAGSDDDTLNGRPLGAMYDSAYRDGSMLYVRVIERQFWKNVVCKIAVYPTGDIRAIEDATESQIQHAIGQGAMLLNRPMRRVRWRVTTQNTVLHDDWSPFKHFTIIPYFPYFRRGRTRGIVDNAIGPQEMTNKAISQYLHIINSIANAGWVVEQNSLTNMTTEDLETEGAKTGLVIEFKKGATPPSKIEANHIPSGIDKLVELGSAKIRVVMGTNDAMSGNGSPDASGIKTQVDQFAGQMSLAVPLDNMGLTRHMLANRLLEMFQSFLTEPQVVQISHRDAAGNLTTTPLPINVEQADGSILNDLTIGEYAAVVSEQPSQITFQNSQFEQCVRMIQDLKIPIPPDVVLRYSNLADKDEIAKRIAAQPTATPLEEAKTALTQAQTSVAAAQAANLQAQAISNQATAVMNKVTALFEGIRTSALLRADPALAAIADEIVASAGFVDANKPPIYPANVAPATTPALPPPGTGLQPDHPGVGAAAGHQIGIRGGGTPTPGA